MFQKVYVKIMILVTVMMSIVLFLMSFNDYSESKANTINLLEYSNKKIIDGGMIYLNSYMQSKLRTITNLATFAANSNEEQIYEMIKILKDIEEFSLVYVAFEENGRMLRSNGKHQYPSDGYD